MTACAYISPRKFPAIVSDIIVSTGKHEDSIRPTTLDAGEPFRRHARKNYIIDGKIGLAFSGDVENIGLALKDIVAQKENIIASKRPMRVVGDIIESFDGIRAVGASTENNSRYSNNFFKHSEAQFNFHSNALGNTVVAGSGGVYLKNKLISISSKPQLQYKDWRSKVSLDILNRVYGVEILRPLKEGQTEFIFSYFYALNIFTFLFQTINISSLVAEINGLHRLGYGGFYEYIYWSLPRNRWMRQEPMVYMLYELVREPDRMFITQVPVAYLYNPGYLRGELWVWRQGLWSFNTLDDIQCGLEEEGTILSIQDPKWRPSVAHIGFVRKKNGQFFLEGSVSTLAGEINEITFTREGNQFSIGMSEEWLDYAGRTFLPL